MSFQIYINLKTTKQFPLDYLVNKVFDMSDTGANAQPVIKADSWCRTVAGNTAKTTFMWTIENFNELPEEKHELSQPSFQSQVLGMAMRLPNGIFVYSPKEKTLMLNKYLSAYTATMTLM